MFEAEIHFNELPFLVAEDSEDDLLLLERALRKAGVRNPRVTTTTGQETIDYLEHGLAFGNSDSFPVVLFLDLVMPKLDGMDVLEWLRDQSHPPLAIVLHTGVEDEDLLQKARDLGASFYLPKGARPEAIREVFRSAQAEWEQHHLMV